VSMDLSSARRVLKWVGLVGSVLLGVVWVLTLFGGGAYIGFTKTIAVSSGRVGFLIYTNDPGDYVGWSWYGNPDVDLGWWPSYDDSTSPAAGPHLRQRTRRLIVPLWIPFLLTAIPTIMLWRRDRRRLVGHCRKCEYDLTGNVTGVCSECGTKVSAEHGPTQHDVSQPAESKPSVAPRPPGRLG